MLNYYKGQAQPSKKKMRRRQSEATQRFEARKWEKLTKAAGEGAPDRELAEVLVPDRELPRGRALGLQRLRPGLHEPRAVRVRGPAADLGDLDSWTSYDFGARRVAVQPACLPPS